MDEMMVRELIHRAENMMQMSYIPYSGFAVGAALLCGDGTIYSGCNIENAAYTPTICAERTAFFKAVSEGHRDFSAIAIVGGKNRRAESFCMPCGVCRQVMMEFCDPKEFKIISAVSADTYKIKTLEELLPEGFGPENLRDS